MGKYQDTYLYYVPKLPTLLIPDTLHLTVVVNWYDLSVIFPPTVTPHLRLVEGSYRDSVHVVESQGH